MRTPKHGTICVNIPEWKMQGCDITSVLSICVIIVQCFAIHYIHLGLYACGRFLNLCQVTETSEVVSQDPSTHFAKRVSALPLANPVFIGSGYDLNQSHRKLALQALTRPGFTMSAEAVSSYETLRKFYKLSETLFPACKQKNNTCHTTSL